MSSRRNGLKRRPDEVLAIISLGRERLQVIDEKVRLLRSMRQQLVSVVQQLESMSTVTCPASGLSKARLKKLVEPPASKYSEGTQKLTCPVANLPRPRSKKP